MRGSTKKISIKRRVRKEKQVVFGFVKYL